MRAARSAVVWPSAWDQEAARALDHQEVAAASAECAPVPREHRRRSGVPRRGRQGGRRRERQRVHADVVLGDWRRGRPPEAARVGRLWLAAGLHRLERDGGGPAAGRGGTGPAATSVLPTPVSVPVTNSPRGAVIRRPRPGPRSRRASGGPWAAERVTRSRDEPGGTVGGRMAGTSSRARATSAAGRPARALDFREAIGTIGPPGGRRPRRRAEQRLARARRRSVRRSRRRSPSGPANKPSRPRRRPRDGRGKRGGEDEGAGAVNEQVAQRGHAGRRIRPRSRRPCPGSQSGRRATMPAARTETAAARAEDAQARGPRPRRGCCQWQRPLRPGRPTGRRRRPC